MKKVLRKWLGRQVIVCLPYRGSIRGKLVESYFRGEYRIAMENGEGFSFRPSHIEFINVTDNRAIWLKGSENPKETIWVKKVN